jgi:sugar O-acyltransferase (sialic acid O-acetyltransferase NeuD family)
MRDELITWDKARDTMKIAIIGAGGQARIVYEILSYDRNMEVVAFVDNVTHGKDGQIMGIPVLGDHSVLPKLLENGVTGAIIGVGDNKTRAGHFEKLRGMGLELVNAIHPTANIARSAKLGSGVVIAMGATIVTGARIGNNVIINTGAIIEHENDIEDHVHVCPGCSIAGRVTIKKGAFIGIGSVVKEYLTIGENTIIGAGSVVLEDIPDNVVAIGAPAKVARKRKEDE